VASFLLSSNETTVKAKKEALHKTQRRRDEEE
jgi:hypothetical protein